MKNRSIALMSVSLAMFAGSTWAADAPATAPAAKEMPKKMSIGECRRVLVAAAKRGGEKTAQEEACATELKHNGKMKIDTVPTDPTKR